MYLACLRAILHPIWTRCRQFRDVVFVFIVCSAAGMAWLILFVITPCTNLTKFTLPPDIEKK